MRLIVVVATLVACASAVEVVREGGYHAAEGIPLAAEIREKEEKAVASQAVFGDRIVGGVIAPAGAHPHFAGLLIDLVNVNGQSVCGATLLSDNRLVTAAHCWFDGWNQAWRFEVILGTSQLYFGGQRQQTQDVVMHPQWTPANLLNDVAMIRLGRRVTFTQSIRPIRLVDTTEAFVGQWATAVGFGKTSDSQSTASSILSQVNLQVISEAQCRAIYGPSFVFSSTLCTNGAGGVGVCSGDSGGPLSIIRNGEPILIGVSSFAADGMCEMGFPSGFARVSSFLSFINQHMW